MPEKLLTLRELSEYLHVKEECLVALVDEKALPAYKIGGELLRFRKEQIDAMRSEIDSRISDEDRIVVSDARKEVKQRHSAQHSMYGDATFSEEVSDFFYFNDFYILSAVLIIILVVVIFKG